MPKARAFFIACAVALCFELTLLLPRPAAAAWPNDPNVNVPLCTAVLDKITPRGISDGMGGAIVTWCDYRSGASWDIYAQHVLASGVVDPAWPADGIALCTAAGHQESPGIVEDGAGGAIVAWADHRGIDPDIYVQHLLASGVVDPAWPADGRVLCTAAGNQHNLAIIADGQGGAIVTWVDDRSNDNADIYAQHVLASGLVDPAWPADGRALCSAAGHQFNPAISADGVGGAIVAWIDSRSEASIYAQHVQGNGAVDPAWPADGRALSTAARAGGQPKIVADCAGGAIVVWEDNRGCTYCSHVYAQHVLASGLTDLAWPVDGRELCETGGYQNYTEIVADGAGGSIVTWVDGRNGNDIYAQRVLASGALDPSWPADGRALGGAGGNQGFPAIVADDAGGAIFAWVDPRQPNDIDIYAQHVLAAGAVDPLWPLDGRATCTADGVQSNPIVVADGASGAIVIWLDKRNSKADVYAQRIDRYGLLGGVVPNAVPGDAAVTFALDPVRPNPSRGGALMVHFALAEAAAASLTLFDVSGRRLAMRNLGSFGAGRHTLELGGRTRLAPGLYLLRLAQGSHVRVGRVVVLE